MIRYRNILVTGVLVPLAAALVGCAGGSSMTEEEERLNEAIEAAGARLMMELPELPGEVEPVRVQNGIPVVQFHAPEDAPAPYTGAYGYGGWLGERGFAVYSAPAADVDARTYMLAEEDDMSEGAPGAIDGFSATWNGVMVGVDTMVDGDGGVLGDAQLDLHSGMGGATVDVEFSNVAGINNDMEYDGHSWTGISLTGSSFADTSDEGGSVDGQFYGDHHENVIGDFAYDSLTGAWGGVRMPADVSGEEDDSMMDDDMMDDDMMDDDMTDDDMTDDDMNDMNDEDDMS